MSDLLSHIDSGKNWLKNHRPNGYEGALKKFDRLKIEAEIIEQASKRKPALGFFGESRVGKSYLVSKLLTNLDELKVKLFKDGEEKDFIKEYNPSGDSEATAVVTRFTKDENAHTMEGYIQTELLGPGSLLYSLYLGYAMEYNPRKDDDKFEEENINNLIATLKSEETSDISPMVIWDVQQGVRQIGEFTRKNEQRDEVVLESYEACWNVIKEADTLSTNHIRTIAKIIFFGNDEIFDFYCDLLKILENRNFPEYVFLPAECLKKLLNTQYMKDYKGEPSEDRIALKFTGLGNVEYNYPVFSTSTNGTIDLFYFQVLTKEISLYAGSNCSEIFNTVDAIDFPGIRAFKDPGLRQQTDFQQKELNNLAKSGKLRFLFYEYTKDLDITYLAFCINPGNIEARHLSDSLKNWVNQYPDNKIDDAKNSLYTIFTKTDETLADEVSEDNADEKWTIRFKSNFLDEFDWSSDFIDTGSYQNLFLVYNPSSKNFNINPDLKVYKSAFINNIYVKSVLGNHANEKWAALNDDGGIGNLHAVLVDTINSSPNRKKENLDNRRNSLKEQCLSVLKQFYVDPDEAAELTASMQAAENIINKLEKKISAIPILFTHCESAFPLKASFETNVGNTFIPPTPEELAKNLYDELINSFETNLNISVPDLAGKRECSEMDEADFYKIFEHYFNYFRRKNDEINSFISDFSNTLDLNSNVDRKIFHESLKWMILGHLSDLWSPWELGEVDLNANTQTFNPYEEHLVKWKKRLPKIFSESTTDQVITGGNDELGGIIKSFKQ
jgi:hypothetical protein